MEISAIFPSMGTYTASLSNGMSHVKLRDMELIRLKKQNKNLDDIDSKREEESNKLAEHIRNC